MSAGSKNDQVNSDRLSPTAEIIESLSDGFFALDPEWHFTFLNRQAAISLKCKPEDLVGQNIWEILPWITGTEHESVYRQVMTAGQVREFEAQGVLPECFYRIRVSSSQNGIFVCWRDITELKQAQEALAGAKAELIERGKEPESEMLKERQRLYSILEELPAMICLITPEYQIRFANRAFRERFGESQGRPCYEYLFKNNSPCGFCEALKVLKTGKPHRWEVQAPDGMTILEAYDMPFTDVDGTKLILEMDIDITNRKKTEKALKDSEERFRQYFQLGLVGMAIKSPTGDFIEVNDRLCEIYGYPREELMQKHWKDLTHPDDLEKDMAQFEQMVNGTINHYSMEKRYIRKNGELVYAVISNGCARKPTGELELVFVMVEDITDRKGAEEAISSQKRMLETITGNTEAQLAYLDPEFNFIMVNAAYEKGSGYSSSELIGKNHFALFPDPENQAVFEQVKNTGRPVMFKAKPFEFKEQTQRETTYWDWTLIPVKDNRGEVQCLVLSLLDVTEYKRAEEALKHYTADLEAANQELEAFSYSVSHNLRQPLRAMESFSDLLIEDYRDRLDETGQDYLNRVIKASQNMALLIDDILKLSQITRTDLHREKVDLKQIADSIMAELQVHHPGREAEISIPSGMTAEGDKELLKIALRNILENAWKFTSKCRMTRIELGMLHENGKEVYFIKDNGIGFDMRYHNKLFEPFQRLHTGKEYPGTGIGLAIVQKVVARHGGKVWAESEKEKGTTIFFTLS